MGVDGDGDDDAAVLAAGISDGAGAGYPS